MTNSVSTPTTTTTKGDLSKSVYPGDDRFKGRERKCLLRCATLISATYAYARGILPESAFVEKPMIDQTVMVFSPSHPDGDFHRQSFGALEDPVGNGEVCEIIFGVFEKASDPSSVVECLKFELFYGTSPQLQIEFSALELRISTRQNFIADLLEVCRRIRTVASDLDPLPRRHSINVICRHNSKWMKNQRVPKNFRLGEYAPTAAALQTLPLCRLELLNADGMNVEFRSKFFKQDVDMIIEELECPVEDPPIDRPPVEEPPADHHPATEDTSVLFLDSEYSAEVPRNASAHHSPERAMDRSVDNVTLLDDRTVIPDRLGPPPPKKSRFTTITHCYENTIIPSLKLLTAANGRVVSRV